MLVFSLRIFCTQASPLGQSEFRYWSTWSIGCKCPETFPSCILYFNFHASFVFKRLKTDNNSRVFGHSLNLQFIFFHWALWERDVCAWPWISPSYKAFESGGLILLFMPHLCTIGANLWAEQNYVVWWAGQMAGENTCEVFWYFWGTAPSS